MLKSRCLQKSKIVDWRLGWGASLLYVGTRPFFCSDSAFIDYCTLNIKKAGQLVKQF